MRAASRLCSVGALRRCARGSSSGKLCSTMSLRGPRWSQTLNSKRLQILRRASSALCTRRACPGSALCEMVASSVGSNAGQLSGKSCTAMVCSVSASRSRMDFSVSFSSVSTSPTRTCALSSTLSRGGLVTAPGAGVDPSSNGGSRAPLNERRSAQHARHRFFNWMAAACRTSNCTCFSAVTCSSIGAAPATCFRFLMFASAGVRKLASALNDCCRVIWSASTFMV
mmetsp:Transcript_10230/g.18602  ORF Transcript_10230/g.18602 Transcript_10230/m.18602 type:complete len:226 (+) Transcript_10230:74-751(+)